MQTLKKFWQEEEAATAMEYGLILGLAAAVIFLGITVFYQGLNDLFNAWGEWFSDKVDDVGGQ